ncbi:GAF domain-containing sensor histidine kinase [Geodermatophilus sp. DSM 44513]|uniref:sensor histidine kinase n=1 Tax=Geodermatophilus sp. DSM 44513 TaxID=1528104 RepID=UPI00128925CE|nr:GAF domain-containing sensor histidine kinase [Geodermatophilus sp. DSM 44513]WNV77664.1 GAF domain-containing sensor histidine kinase [Geodermatophilus sp. DSM 44513]
MSEVEGLLTPAALVEAAQQMGGERTRAGALARVVSLTASLVPGAEQTSVTVLVGDRLITLAASGPVARQLDEVQDEAGEGPCLTAARDGDPVLVEDTAVERRWPRYASRAQVLRVGSTLSLPMPLPMPAGSRMTGSLNICSSEAAAFTPAARTVASVLLGQATLALISATERERAADRVAQVESVLGLLVHDLRSGMTVALSGQDHLASQRDQLDPTGREALDLLGDELHRQQHLLTELVELVRAELPSTRATALLPVVRAAADLHRRPVPVLHGPDAESVVVRIHPLRLRRILANLLDHAERHADGATALRVSGAEVVAWVAVEDAGPGVPVERREGIFTRLVNSPVPADVREGSHLGLALSRLHARLAGGDLIVEDRPGGGARFVLALPTASSPVPIASTADRQLRVDAE